MWQKLQDDLADRNFTILAIAMDTPDAARPWIEAARPTYPCLIDRDHHVADLYNMSNVPQAVWIDESGRIVRPPENAGSDDGFRAMDRKTKTLSAELIAERNRIKSAYLDAVHDWAVNGQASQHVLDAQSASARVSLPDDDSAAAHVHFRLGNHLLRRGKNDEAALHFAEASRLHPKSWNMWRQIAQKEASGLASGPDFWARVDALGTSHYYPPIQMKGINR